MRRPTPPVLALLFSLLLLPALAHPPGEAVEDMSAAANAWLASLTPALRTGATYPLQDAEREEWHYIPKSRAGVSLGQMDARQRELARALLASGLSQHGMLQAEAVIALERVLRAVENSDHRDESLYYFTVFGSPGDTAWGWRVEGHHLSVNFTIVDGHVAATPNFVGANPAEVRTPGPQSGKRALAAEEDLGRAFVLSLDPAQQRVAIIAKDAPGDILTRASKVATPPEPTGIGYAALNATQQAAFKALVAVYANRLRPDVAAVELKKIADAGWDRLAFAWAGGLEPGQGLYYRIQGPEFVIEYDNVQNGANHIHTVWRVFAGDFGRDLLQEHYRESHSGKKP